MYAILSRDRLQDKKKKTSYHITLPPLQHTHISTHIEEVSQVRFPKSKRNIADMESLRLTLTF